MRITKARAAATAATITAVAAAGVAAPSNAQYQDIPKPATVEMVMKGKLPVFKGPKTVSKGAKLTIVNKTSLKQIGPHTFSLVKPAKVPSKKQWKQCGEKLELLCGEIARAHKVNMETGQPGKVFLDVGKKGFDKSFGKKGDSWFTDAKGDEFSRKVTAKAGSTLTYFCAVHPNMVGKIKVTKK